MGRWFGKDDVTRAERVKWQAGEQQAGRGTIVNCIVCGGDGTDPGDPGADCLACRGVGTAIDDRGR